MRRTSSSLVPVLAKALDRMVGEALVGTGVISWSSPIPVFGDPSTARLATLGINPSNREFVDAAGQELVGRSRRFHTLQSLCIDRWADADAGHLQLMLAASGAYFSNNPYDGWFRRLDQVISGVGATFYGKEPSACHLDLIPFATSEKWTRLRARQRLQLLETSGDILGCLVRDSAIETLVLNGQTVVSYFEHLAGSTLRRRAIPGWRLVRKSSPDVAGIAYVGVVSRLGGVSLDRTVLAVGFNHNLQSSFGITTSVMVGIQSWLGRVARPEPQE